MGACCTSTPPEVAYRPINVDKPPSELIHPPPDAFSHDIYHAFYYQSPKTNKPYLITVNERSINSFDINNKVWCNTITIPLYLPQLCDSYACIDNINDKLYILLQNLFFVLDLISFKWNLIKQHSALRDHSSNNSLWILSHNQGTKMHDKSTSANTDYKLNIGLKWRDDETNEWKKGMMKRGCKETDNHIFIEAVGMFDRKFHEEKMMMDDDNFVKDQELIAKMNKIIFVYDIDNMWCIMRITPNTIEETRMIPKEYEYYGHPFYIPSQRRLYTLDGWSKCVKNTNDLRSEQGWKQVDGLSLEKHRIQTRMDTAQDYNYFNFVMEISSKCIAVFLWADNRVYFIDFIMETIVSRDISNAGLNNMRFAAYDEESMNICFVARSGIIKIVKSFEVLPLECYVWWIVRGLMRECNKLYVDQIPIELMRIICNYYGKYLEFEF